MGLARTYSILARSLAVVVSWLVLMGLPLMFFHAPLGTADFKRFLGVFYALLLFVATVVMRGWGASSLLLMALPFLALFTALGVRPLLEPAMDGITSLNFFAIYGVVFLAWRLGKRPPVELSKDEDQTLM